MMVEIIDGVLQVDPHKINGINQSPSNGFKKWWKNWADINAMIKLVKQHLCKNIDKYILVHMKSEFYVVA